MAYEAMTFDSLKATILGYSERGADSQLNDELARLVSLAENECAARLQTLATSQVAEGSIGADAATIEKPTFWRRSNSFFLLHPTRGRIPVNQRSLEYVQTFWPVRTATGVPRFYAEYDYNNFLVAPSPDAGYAFELNYVARLDPLSDENQTNWLTANAPQVLLYASMKHANLFLKNAGRADGWGEKFDSAVAELLLEDRTRRGDNAEKLR